jgi:hypothetical protein
LTALTLTDAVSVALLNAVVPPVAPITTSPPSWPAL